MFVANNYFLYNQQTRDNMFPSNLPTIDSFQPMTLSITIHMAILNTHVILVEGYVRCGHASLVLFITGSRIRVLIGKFPPI